MSASLWVARHPPVVGRGICYGQSDMRAETPPEEAAATVATSLAQRGLRPSRVVTSPWSRTRETADALARQLRIPCIEDARISELHFGAWEGRTYESLANDETFQAWGAAWTREAAPGGESVLMLMSRVRAFGREIALRNDTTLAITHAGVIRALRALAQGLDVPAASFEHVHHLALERVELSAVR